MGTKMTVFKRHTLALLHIFKKNLSQLRKISFSPATRGLFAKLAFLQHFKTIATQKIPTWLTIWAMLDSTGIIRDVVKNLRAITVNTPKKG